MKTKKATIGVGIILLAVLLFLGGMLMSDDITWNTSGKNKYPDEISLNDDVIFQINSTIIGKQEKVTQNFPNIELGSKTEYETIYASNPFRLTANPFAQSDSDFLINVENPENVKHFLLYFNTKRYSGENLISVKVNGKKVAQTDGSPVQIPLILPKVENQSFILTIEIEKPALYNIFNWNKADLTEMKLVAVTNNANNKVKQFNFDVDKNFLERTYIDLLVSCENPTKELLPALKVKVNDYILTDKNPRC
ncbi:MAG: hypothetical protein ACOC2U_04815, partial [bacterium]